MDKTCLNCVYSLHEEDILYNGYDLDEENYKLIGDCAIGRMPDPNGICEEYERDYTIKRTKND